MKPLEIDTFQYKHHPSLVAKRQRIIWDYNDEKGILHSGVVDSLDEALEKAKEFGYQSNKTAKSKSQHDLVGKLYTHKSTTERIRENLSTCMKRYLKSLKRNGLDILGMGLCVGLLAGSIVMYAGALTAICTGVLAGAITSAIANFIILYNSIYNKRDEYNLKNKQHKNHSF